MCASERGGRERAIETKEKERQRERETVREKKYV